MHNTRKIIALSLLLLLAACSSPQSLNIAAIQNSNLSNLNIPESNVLASGQPTQEQIKVLAEAGVQHIVSLRRPSEIDWDERSIVEANGMQFHSIPVAGITGVTKENATKLEDLLNSLGSDAVLVHCGSSNRVGALKTLASLDSNDTASIEAAFAEGRRWGLTRMEGALREKLESE